MDESWSTTVSEIYNSDPVFWVENECVWSKMTFFRWLVVLEGTFMPPPPLNFECGPDASVVTCPWYPKRCSNFNFSIFGGTFVACLGGILEVL